MDVGNVSNPLVKMIIYHKTGVVGDYDLTSEDEVLQLLRRRRRRKREADILLELRLLHDEDISLIENWLHQEHVKRWYEIPHLGVSISDWMYELKERHGEFKWLTHLIVLWQGRPIDYASTINVKTVKMKILESCPFPAHMGLTI